MNTKVSNYVFRYMPAALFIAYGITMVLLVYQYRAVGLYPTIFRAVAWQAVLALALADRSHLENKEKVQALEAEIAKALNTIGIRRDEFNELKRDVERVRDYLARTHELSLGKD